MYFPRPPPSVASSYVSLRTPTPNSYRRIPALAAVLCGNGGAFPPPLLPIPRPRVRLFGLSTPTTARERRKSFLCRQTTITSPFYAPLLIPTPPLWDIDLLPTLVSSAPMAHHRRLIKVAVVVVLVVVVVVAAMVAAAAATAISPLRLVWARRCRVPSAPLSLLTAS